MNNIANNPHHESAIKHVTGEALYINDISIDRLLIGHIVGSPYACAKIKSFNIEKALEFQGIKAILSYKDIPGDNEMGPVFQDEPCLAEDKVNFIGQGVFLIAAESKEIAREAEKFIHIVYEPLDVIIDLKTAIEKNNRLHPPRKIACGNIEKGFKESEHILEGELITGGQEHWYLETQSCLAIPGEGKEIKILSSTQHPSETQAIVAEVLGIQRNEVEVEVKRMGGAFGGKETQANHYAAWSALLANATGQPVKIHLTRDEDQITTGKRHEALSKYKVGFSSNGKLTALDVDLNLDAGSSSDLTMAILERAMFHIDNAYFIPNVSIIGNTWKTNKPSNTAFRGFGGPQGMAVIENIIDRIARFIGQDSLEIRNLNFYKSDSENITPYSQKVENNRLPLLYDQLVKSSEYFKRREEISRFNKENEFYKKGLSLTPVKFGISFTTSFLNQAGALVNIYKDGSVLVNHGGTEMGQGLHTKILQIASSELGISSEFIKVTATNTSKVPNTSATAASSGSDINGMAVKNAITKLKKRLAEVALNIWNFNKELRKNIEIEFKNNEVFVASQPEINISFTELIDKAYLERTSLSATGFYKIPGIYFDREKGKGTPFHYFAFGMAVSEVLVDTLTGYVKLLRTDILHDVGKSINEGLDRGQIEGGFVQGLGWVTTEDLKYDDKGNLLNHSPDTYKIPTIRDIPKDFRVDILKNVPNPNTIKQSKAVGEPPFMLALSVWLAIKDAISAVGNHKFEPEFELPATNEVVLGAVEKIKHEINKLQP
ncbi:MAG: xanthine dehydrogenase molybdopterin binding subunit [Bacteroidales bacterium]|nr:xanthine dehydrogenase molybdopterin binding subunit [Bacteroidales bacterium]